MAVPLMVAVHATGAQRVTAAAETRAWLFTWSVTPTADGRAVSGGTLILDVAVWHGAVRIGVREGPLRALTGDGGTILLNAVDSSLVVVKPARREALTAASGDLGALMGGPGAGVPLELSDVGSSTRVRGAGERIFGFGTRRVQLTEHYTLQLNTPTVRRAIHVEQTHDIEISREIAQLDPGFQAFASQFARSVGLPPGVRVRLRALERSMPAGVPVRTASAAVTVAGSDTLRTTTRAEMSALRQELVDTMTFRVPAGYRVTEMSRLLQQPRRP